MKRDDGFVGAFLQTDMTALLADNLKTFSFKK